MPATENRPVRRLIDNRIRSALCTLALGLTLVDLAGCRSPLGGQAALTADLSLSFIVSGAERLARDATAQRALGGSPYVSSRLLLPTATSLSVTLTPESGGDAIATDPVSIVAGAATVPVSLSAVPYGSYTVKAEAKDASGVARFTQSAPLVVGDPELSATFNLVPTDPDGAALVSATLQDIDIAELPAGEARTWLVAAGSGLLAARSIFLAGLEGESRAFLQTADGTLVSDPLGTATRLSTAGLPAGEPAYLTVYNGGGATLNFARAFPGPAMVDVPAGAFQRDATATNVSHVSAFSMADLEVTRELYLAVMGTDPVTSNSSGTGDPVQSVNWYRAIAFCNKLSLLEGLAPAYAVTGVNFASLDFNSIPPGNDTTWNAAVFDATANGYRLPTEMEWRWAAMGATSDRTNGYSGTGINTTGYTKGYAGSTEMGGAQVNIVDYAWSSANSGGNTHPAGKKTPNELGIFDMSGNVWEWCWDLHGSYPSGALVNYLGVTASGERMFVGGSHEDTTGQENIFPISNRNHTNRDPSMIAATAGFRVARGALPTYRANFVETAEALTVGSDNLNGQNGWVADTTGGSSAQVINGHGVNTTNILGSSARYRRSSHALGGTIDMTDPKKAYRLSYDSVKPTWGTHFGIAADMDHDGVIAAGEEVWNFRVDSSGTTPNLAYLVRPSGQISASIASVPGLDYDTWFQTELYFTQGMVTIRVKPWSTGVWTTVWSDVSMETTANGDKTNPANWSHLYFSMAEIDGYLDNIAFETITLP